MTNRELELNHLAVNFCELEDQLESLVRQNLEELYNRMEQGEEITPDAVHRKFMSFPGEATARAGKLLFKGKIK